MRGIGELVELIIQLYIYLLTTTSSVMKGKQFSRDIRIYKLVLETQSRLEWDQSQRCVVEGDDLEVLEHLKLL